jgi:hypothetical protein
MKLNPPKSVWEDPWAGLLPVRVGQPPTKGGVAQGHLTPTCHLTNRSMPYPTTDADQDVLELTIWHLKPRISCLGKS